MPIGSDLTSSGGGPEEQEELNALMDEFDRITEVPGIPMAEQGRLRIVLVLYHADFPMPAELDNLCEPLARLPAQDERRGI